MQWIKTRVKKIKKWDDNFFSIFLENNINSFIGGQFTKLAFRDVNKFNFRYYSFVNSTKDKNLEFFIKKNKKNFFSNLLFNLIPNDYIYITKYSSGNFIINNISKIDILWMICIGTSIAPFLSILKSDYISIKKKFKRIFFLYGVKYLNKIFYLDKLLLFKKKYGFNYLNLFFAVSNNKNFFIKKENIINGHINDFFLNFNLIKYINNNNNHFMICGNIKMINSITKILEKKFFINKKNITTEGY